MTWLRKLLQPSARWSVLSLLATGVVLALAGMLAFDYGMQASSTDAFCTSCHEMHIPRAQLQKTVHYTNTSGVTAGCADCHLPHEFGPKMVTKIKAAREVWGAITGVIDTPEKYAAHVPKMKAREIARLRANDSRECRNCHDADRMFLLGQTSKAQKYHQVMVNRGRTCIDCHAGQAHPGTASSGSTQ